MSNYWSGGYTLEDLVSYCDNSGIDRKDIRLVCSIYDIDNKTGENHGCKMSEVQNLRLCITDSFVEFMVRKDNLKNDLKL